MSLRDRFYEKVVPPIFITVLVLAIALLCFVIFKGVVSATPFAKATVYHTDGTVELFEDVESVFPEQTNFRANTSVIVIKTKDKTYRLYNAEVKVEEDNQKENIS